MNITLFWTMKAFDYEVVFCFYSPTFFFFFLGDHSVIMSVSDFVRMTSPEPFNHLNLVCIITRQCVMHKS